MKIYVDELKLFISVEHICMYILFMIQNARHISYSTKLPLQIQNRQVEEMRKFSSYSNPTSLYIINLGVFLFSFPNLFHSFHNFSSLAQLKSKIKPGDKYF